MKYVAIASFISLSAVVHGFVAFPATTSRARLSRSVVSVHAASNFMPRRSAGAHATTGALKMSSSMNDATQPTLEQWITFAEPKLQSTLIAMFAACKEIAYKVRTASCDKMACFNEFGDEQLAIDVLANNVIFENLKACGCCATASSEETPVEDPMGGEGYSVAFDPLDGSSIIDTNFAVGTIFGVWPGSRLVGVSGRDLKGAGMAVYGPRTTMTVAVDGMDGSHEFLLVDDFSGRHGQWVKTNTFTTIDDGKLFAPGNLRGTQDNPGYNELFNFYLSNKYQLRYTGGMVPDVNQIMVKGKGIFVNPASASAPAKLRVLYEVGPIAYLIEKAGGKSSDGENSALDIQIPHTEVRSQVAYGSIGEVDRFESMVGVKAMQAI
ncbi:unnamed protein product [Ascophyllum nodosum]